MIAISNRVDIEIDRQRVLLSIGYRTNRKPSVRVGSVVDEHIETAHQLMEPAYSYIIKDIEAVRRSCVFLDGSIVFESEVMARLMEQCKMVTVFLVTIGSRLEKMVLRLAEDGWQRIRG